ncbi:4Fe-4S binding protein [candidate division KSB1 bacterium]
MFLDFRNLFPVISINILNYLQFVPSVFKFINVLGFAATGFIIVLLFTYLFGRVYCSFLCPLGILQDLVSRFSKWAHKKKKYTFTKSLNWLRYAILVITILVLLSGSILLVNLLDPFGIFGRITVNLFRPVFITMNNLLVNILESFNSYLLFPYDILHYSWISISISFVFLVFIVWMAYKRGRLYCNTVCPVGALLSLLSRYSLLKIRMNELACTGCGLCEGDCKAECIDTENRWVDMSRCINCFNCFRACPEKGFEYSISHHISSKSNTHKISTSRRKFFLSITTALIGLTSIARAQIAKVIPDVKNTALIPEEKEFPVAPPGSISIDHFNSTCTACHLCIIECPAQVLQPSLTAYGLKGLLQPRMDYQTSYCNYDCTICTEICPSGALLNQSTDEKHTTQLGKAVFIKKNCIVFTEDTDCGACSEHCPTKAVDMVSFRSNLHIPDVDTDICVGCGACENICPTTPYKAIYVNGNPVHLKVEKPVEVEIEEQEILEEDFPF